MSMHPILGRRPAAAVLALAAALWAAPAEAQWSQVYEQFYLPASHNWQFRHSYPAADRLFNAFDYGHAILYETLYTAPNAPAERLETKEYDFITRELLTHPPRVPLEEAAIEVAYAKLAPEAKAMFDWAHLLHRQIYDVWADESIPVAEKDARVAELLAYYRSRPDLAFSSVPKGMELMDGQYYSLGFRRKYPKFNGLIWAYHWLQIGLYEPLMTGRNADERQAGVAATVARFRQMLENPPATMPYLMPMTSGVAPTFARRYPEAGAIFDNLHMMHDVVSDILVSTEVPRSAKRQEILRAAARFRSDTADAVSYETWLGMGEMMGVNNMGGRAGQVLAELPRPTVERGMSMAGMGHGNMAGMQGMQHGNMPGMQRGDTTGMAGMQHGNMPGMQRGDSAAGMAGMQHGNMPGMQGRTTMQGMQMQPAGSMQMGGMTMQQMMAMHERMMADPVIRERVATDPVLQRMMREMGSSGGGMPGMNGMNMSMSGAAATLGDASASPEDRRQAVEFVVRLLSDAEVAARVQADPELRRLWWDPDVQRRLAELRRAQAAPAAQPPQPVQPSHSHR